MLSKFWLYRVDYIYNEHSRHQPTYFVKWDSARIEFNRATIIGGVGTIELWGWNFRDGWLLIFENFESEPIVIM